MIIRSPGPGHGLSSGAAIRQALLDGPTPGRAYLLDDCGHLVKVVDDALDPTSTARVQDLEGEAGILQEARGIKGVAEFVFLQCTPEWKALGTTYIPGAALARQRLSPRHVVRVLWQVALVVGRLSARGIAHNDIRPENIIVSARGDAWLIDFDQATSGHGRLRAFILNTVGSHFHRNEAVVHGSFRTLMRGLLRRRELRKQQQLPSQTRLRTERQRQLYAAWRKAQQSDANAPGQGVAYYALDVDGVHFPGERPWRERWEVLRNITNFHGKRIIELGCNMGLLSVYLKRYAGASNVLGVDNDAEILDSAAMVADAFGASVEWRMVDLGRDEPAVDELAAFGADIITCLNVWNWVPEREVLTRLLASAPEIIFEGHEDDARERERLLSFGFDDVRIVATTERGRPLLHGRKVGELG